MDLEASAVRECAFSCMYCVKADKIVTENAKKIQKRSFFMIFYDNGMISAEQLDLETPVILLHKKSNTKTVIYDHFQTVFPVQDSAIPLNIAAL